MRPKTSKSSKKPPRLSRVQMAVAVASIVVFLGTVELHSAHQQRLAVQAIYELGGSVSYHGARVNPPRWLRERLGTDALQAVWGVNFNGQQFDDESLLLLSRLSDMYALSLTSSRVTDEGMRHLAHLTQLQFLDLSRTAVTARGIEHLASLRKLQWLYVRHTGVQSSDLSHLKSILPHTEIYIARPQPPSPETVPIYDPFWLPESSGLTTVCASPRPDDPY